MEFSRPKEWVAVPFSRGSSQPGIQPRSPALQVGSLPAEPPGKPKNTGVGSLSLLQGNLPDPGFRTGVSYPADGFFTDWATGNLGFLAASDGKGPSLPMQETQVRSQGWEDPLEKEMATHPSILAWRIPWTEEPGRLQSMGSQRVRYDWETNIFKGKCNDFFSRHLLRADVVLGTV